MRRDERGSVNKFEVCWTERHEARFSFVYSRLFPLFYQTSLRVACIVAKAVIAEIVDVE